MPPILALVLCTLFVGWLLRIDHRRSTEVTSAVWIPTVWFFLIASKPLGRWFAVGTTQLEGSPLDRLVLIVLIVSGFGVLIKRQINWGLVFREFNWVFILLGYMLLSTLWADESFISFKRWVREMAAVIMALILVTEPNPRAALESILRRMSYVLIPYSLMLIKYYPYYGVSFHDWSGARMWVGVALQKNGLGRLCLVAAFYLIWTLVRRYRGKDGPPVKHQNLGDLMVLFLTLWLLKGPGLKAYSATSIASLAAGIMTFLVLGWRHARGVAIPSRGMILFALMFIMTIGFATPFLGGSTVGGVTSLLGRDSTLTGRTDIWAGALEYADSPILGSGLGAFWTSETRNALRIGVAHNGYLDAYLNLGIVGVGLIAVFVLSCGSKAVRALHYDFEFGCFAIGMIVMVTLHNFAESSIQSLTLHLTATILLISATSFGMLLGWRPSPETTPAPLDGEPEW